MFFYEWESSCIQFEQSTNLNHPTEYRVVCDNDESVDETNPHAMDDLSDLDEIEDKFKVAAIMMCLEY